MMVPFGRFEALVEERIEHRHGWRRKSKSLIPNKVKDLLFLFGSSYKCHKESILVMLQKQRRRWMMAREITCYVKERNTEFWLRTKRVVLQVCLVDKEALRSSMFARAVCVLIFYCCGAKHCLFRLRGSFSFLMMLPSTFNDSQYLLNVFIYLSN